MSQAKQWIEQWIEMNQEEYLLAGQTLWEKPELSMQEYQSVSILTDLLESHGFRVERGVVDLPTAFVATYGRGDPVIAFSSEYDALPGLSQKLDCNFKEPVFAGAPGHGCGHNLMGITGIMSASALKHFMESNNIKGTIKIFGTPAEELCIGKPYMARAGLFEGIDAFLDWHPTYSNKAGSCKNNAYFNIKYHFTGKSAHGNSPWFGRSSLDAGMLMGHAIEMLREHIKPGNNPESAPTINYAFPDVGNSFPNVVPDRTTVWCIGRVKDAEQAAEVIARVDKCAEGAAIATETTVEREFVTATHNMIPNLRISNALEENLNRIGAPSYSLEENNAAIDIQKKLGIAETGFTREIIPVSLSSMPVTDSSEYSWFAPLGFLNLALIPSESCGWHNWVVTRFAGSSVGKKVVITASKILATTGYDLLTNPEIIKESKEELNQRLKGRTYKTLLSEDAKPDLYINSDIMDKYKKFDFKE